MSITLPEPHLEHSWADEPVRLYGLLAEFPDAESLVAAAEWLHGSGYRRVEAYTPFPVAGLSEALGFTRTGMARMVLTGALIGLVGGFYLQYWVSVIEYPLNIGGRPLNSWPAFIPVTFELTILTAALFAVLGMLALNGLPRPHHPLFAIPAFDRASSHAFFLAIQAIDPKFQIERTRAELEALHPKAMWDVPEDT